MTSKPSKGSSGASQGMLKLNPKLREAFDNFCSAWIDAMDSLTEKERAVFEKISQQSVRNVLKKRKKPVRSLKRRRRKHS